MNNNVRTVSELHDLLNSVTYSSISSRHKSNSSSSSGGAISRFSSSLISHTFNPLMMVCRSGSISI